MLEKVPCGNFNTFNRSDGLKKRPLEKRVLSNKIGSFDGALIKEAEVLLIYLFIYCIIIIIIKIIHIYICCYHANELQCTSVIMRSLFIYLIFYLIYLVILMV